MYIIIPYDVTGCFLIGIVLRMANCTAERKQNEARKQGRTRLAEAIPSCWTYAGAGGFLIAVQLRTVNAPQSGRNRPNLGLTRKQVECTMQTENPSEGP